MARNVNGNGFNPLDPLGFFDSAREEVDNIADSFAETIQRRKEELATQTVLNLVKAGVLKPDEIGYKERLMQLDLPTLTLNFVQSHMLREAESIRLGREGP